MPAAALDHSAVLESCRDGSSLKRRETKESTIRSVTDLSRFCDRYSTNSVIAHENRRTALDNNPPCQ